jgi:hypothetical protein
MAESLFKIDARLFRIEGYREKLRILKETQELIQKELGDRIVEIKEKVEGRRLDQMQENYKQDNRISELHDVCQKIPPRMDGRSYLGLRAGTTANYQE